jgi:hypothetical protein
MQYVSHIRSWQGCLAWGWYAAIHENLDIRRKGRPVVHGLQWGPSTDSNNIMRNCLHNQGTMILVFATTWRGGQELCAQCCSHQVKGSCCDLR